jgi:serine/threonine-protein phosphatase 2A regulatory subunit A
MSINLSFQIAKVEDYDQVLLMISEKLEKFLPLVGGPEFSHLLVPLFEALCNTEEVSVRNLAAQSCCKILKQLTPNFKHQVAAYFEFLKRLANEESGELFYSRVSSCFIVVDLYPLLSDADKVILREIYGRLCKDEMPNVRSYAANCFMLFAQIVNDSEIIYNEFLSLLKTLVADECQIIQVIGIEAISPYSLLLKKFNHSTVISNDFLNYIKIYCDDPSWRIRQALCKKFALFAQSFTNSEINTDIFPALLHMVLDPEPEVRTVAVDEIFPFLDIMGPQQFMTEFSPIAHQLVDDPMNTVRKQLAELCVKILSKITPEAVSHHISDLVLKLINDEDSLVKLRIVKNLPTIAQESPPLCTRLTDVLKLLFSHSNWRLRKALVEAMPAVVKFMGPEFFSEHYLNMCISLIKDGTEEVRQAASLSISLIAANITDINWIYDKLFSHYKTVASEDYLIRLNMITALHGFLMLENISYHPKFQSETISLIVTLTSDKVPNVRLRAAQIIFNILVTLSSSSNHAYLTLSSGLKDQMETAIKELQNDKDKDVRHFASHASNMSTGSHSSQNK